MTPAQPQVCPLLHEQDHDWGWALVGPVTLRGRPLHSHVVPNCDLRRHQLDPTCWCGPEEDDNQADLWLHNAADDRDAYATGAREPN